MQQIWLPFIHEVDIKLRGDRHVTSYWACDTHPFDIEEIDANSAPVALKCRIGSNDISWRLHQDRLIRPVLDADGNPCSSIEQLAATEWGDLVRHSHDNNDWPGHPFQIDERFEPRHDRHLRYNFRARDEIDAYPIREVLRDERDARIEWMRQRLQEMVLVDGVPHVFAPEPVICLSMTPYPNPVVTVALAAPPTLLKSNIYMGTIYLGADEAELARETVRQLVDMVVVHAPDDALPLRIIDGIAPVERYEAAPPSDHPDRWTLLSFASYAAQALEHYKIKDADHLALLAMLHAKETCRRGVFDAETVGRSMDLIADCRHASLDANTNPGAILATMASARAVAEQIVLANEHLSGLNI